ncbi:hypothetical protein F5884DRAFT_878457 [Xylogone sp. PMI_703]|nr:hypothetical protein F5884DRAFT_878457 [Xylogone sp. PMI_703]
MYIFLLATLQCLVLASDRTSSHLPLPTFTDAQLSHETVTFDRNTVADSAVPLNRNLLGLSIEFCYITAYLGDLSKANAFSRQLLQNIQDRIGSPPRIRIGGDTQDVARYCDDCSQTLNNTFRSSPTNPLETEAVNVTFNRNLFRVLNENAPSEQQYTFGLNLGQNSFEYPLAELQAAEKYMNVSRFIAYELGNEPDVYYLYSDKRGPGWNITTYAQQSVDFLLQLTASLSAQQSRHFPGYMYGSTNFDVFPFASLVQLGVFDIVKGIEQLSRHCYFGQACSVPDAIPLTTLLDHYNTLTVTQGYIPSIAAAKSIGTQFIMGETNSLSCHGLTGVSDTIGAALWMLDYSLTGATLGMDGLNFHNGVGYPYSAWEPTTINGTAPYAKGIYYGFLFFADLVSDIRAPRISHIHSLDLSDSAHYALFSSSRQVQKLVILNLDYCNSTTPRTYKTSDVSSVLGRKLKVTRLTASSSIATCGLTWAGQTVNQSGKLSGKKIIEIVKDGIVSIGSSEGVIIERG